MRKMLKRLQRVFRVRQVDPRQRGSPGGDSAKENAKKKVQVVDGDSGKRMIKSRRAEM